MEHTQLEESVKQELKSMDQRLSDLEEKMTSIDTKLSQVIDAILGNPLTKTGGFAERVDLLEEKLLLLENKVEKQDEFRRRLTWIVGFIATTAIVIDFVVRFIKNVM